MSYEFLNLSITEHVAEVVLNRPQQANALNMKLWSEVEAVFHELDQNPDARVVVLRGEGKHFCAGIDLGDFSSIMQSEESCEGRKREQLRRTILKLQGAFTAIERCRKPVIAAIHNACIGAGVDMVTACDLRFCSEEAYFVVKEIDIGIVADVGTLQRLPSLIGEGLTRELAYTGRKMPAAEAAQARLVNRTFESPEALITEVQAIAKTIAEKSPLAIRGTKEILNYSRDHSVTDSLDYVATWNAAMLLSNDVMEAVTAGMQQRKPKFQ